MEIEPIMRYYISLILLVSTSIAYCQEKEDENKVKFGVNLSAFFNIYDFGITPTGTIDIGKHQLSIGPTLTFNSYTGENWKEGSYAVNFNYRFYPFANFEKIKPFAQYTTIYMYNRRDYIGYYDPTDLLQGPSPATSYSFDLHYTNKTHNVLLLLGAGAEVSIWKKLYAAVSGTFGALVHAQKEIYLNTETNVVEAEYTTSLTFRRFEWLVFSGIGYRF